MLVCIDGLLGSRVVEQSPVQQSVRHYYEIMGFFKNNGNFLAKLATIGFSWRALLHSVSYLNLNLNDSYSTAGQQTSVFGHF